MVDIFGSLEPNCPSFGTVGFEAIYLVQVALVDSRDQRGSYASLGKDSVLLGMLLKAVLVDICNGIKGALVQAEYVGNRFCCCMKCVGYLLLLNAIPYTYTLDLMHAFNLWSMINVAK